MTFFQRVGRYLFNLGPAVEPPDPSFGNIQIQALRRALARDEWQGLVKVLDTEQDPHTRDQIVEACISFPGRPLWLDRAVARYPGPTTLLLRGTHSARWAWEARGGGTNNTVSRAMFEVFFERLIAAEADLRQVIKMDPTDPTPWVYLLLTGRGLGLGISENRTRFEAVMERAPEHRSGHFMFLQVLTPKWGGSSYEMFRFARDAYLRDPGRYAGLLLQAHVEQFIEYCLGKDRQLAETYYSLGSNPKEALKAIHTGLDALPYLPQSWGIADLNIFAWTAFELRDRALARQCFTLLNQQVARYPWGYFGQPAQQFAGCERAATF